MSIPFYKNIYTWIKRYLRGDPINKMRLRDGFKKMSLQKKPHTFH